jgi:hypothetical protein
MQEPAMNADQSLSTTDLERGQLQRLNAGEGRHVLKLEGSLWLTQQGDTRAIVLEAGDIASSITG